MKPTTERDYRQRIARVIEAILVDPAAPHTVDSLATVAHLSPFHFHRIYRALTGESIAATVRRVRLAQAAHRLAGTGDTVTAIALQAGYDSSQTFARAFRGFAGVSPCEFQVQQSHLAAPASGVSELETAAVEPPRVDLIDMPPTEALCLRHQGPLATIPHTFRTLLKTLRCDRDSPQIRGAIGISSGDPEDREGFTYFAGILPAAPLEPVRPIETIRVEGGLYASYRLIGPYALIAPSFKTLFGGWLPQSGHDPDDRPALELYRSPPSVAPSECVTDLLIPIRPE